MSYDYFLHPDKAVNALFAICLFIFGFLLAKKLSNVLEKIFIKRISRHHTMLIKRTVFYSVFIVFSVTGLQHLGFKLSVFLGAAGVFTVALSFASQTAASNLISGIFLLFEHPFKVGDVVEVKGINGVVDSIDLLSTKLKTPDNKLVRIPNEAMIKSEITNLSYFSTRRLDLIIAVAYNCDIIQVRSLLLEVANHCEKVLKDPEPQVSINNFANAAIELKFMVWANTEEVSSTRNQLQEMIKERFDREGIEAPTPQSSMQAI